MLKFSTILRATRTQIEQIRWIDARPVYEARVTFERPWILTICIYIRFRRVPEFVSGVLWDFPGDIDDSSNFPVRFTRNS